MIYLKRTLLLILSSLLMLVMGCAGIQEVATEDFKVAVTTDSDIVSQSDIDRVKREAEHALVSISSFLGTEKRKTIDVRIVDKGIVRTSGGTVFLPAWHVQSKKAAIVGIISYILAKHGENKFFALGLSVYFQERFGEDHGFPNFAGEPLDDLVRRYKNQLMPIYKLASNNEIFRQVGAIDRKIAYIEAGSFIGFLIEMYGEGKLRELHDSRSLDYSKVYGKNLKELEVEWKEFVFR